MLKLRYFAKEIDLIFFSVFHRNDYCRNTCNSSSGMKCSAFILFFTFFSACVFCRTNFTRYSFSVMKTNRFILVIAYITSNKTFPSFYMFSKVGEASTSNTKVPEDRNKKKKVKVRKFSINACKPS